MKGSGKHVATCCSLLWSMHGFVIRRWQVDGRRSGRSCRWRRGAGRVSLLLLLVHGGRRRRTGLPLARLRWHVLVGVRLLRCVPLSLTKHRSWRQVHLLSCHSRQLVDVVVDFSAHAAKANLDLCTCVTVKFPNSAHANLDPVKSVDHGDHPHANLDLPANCHLRFAHSNLARLPHERVCRAHTDLCFALHRIPREIIVPLFGRTGTHGAAVSAACVREMFGHARAPASSRRCTHIFISNFDHFLTWRRSGRRCELVPRRCWPPFCLWSAGLPPDVRLLSDVPLRAMSLLQCRPTCSLSWHREMCLCRPQMPTFKPSAASTPCPPARSSLTCQAVRSWCG
eukprot:m.65231 g.65231  ORF g.65231 m.65231 type:complete len:340 (-) comp13660_c0_seq1:1142-2161(-)